jgi:OOP family OmpA-OmpF porin
MARARLARMRALAGASFALPLTGAIASAQTAPSIDARTWQPSADPRANLVLEPPATPGAWQWNLGVFTQYARDPVVLRGVGETQGPPIAHLIGADVVAGIGLGDRASLGVDLPLVAWQSGASSLPSDVVRGGRVPPQAIGDLAVLGKATIVSNDHEGIEGGWGLALLGALSIPTGGGAGFLSDGALDASVRLLTEYALGPGALRAVAGYSGRTQQRTWPDANGDGVTFGDSIPWAIGAVVRPKGIGAILDSGDRQRWEVAAHGALPAGPVAPLGLGKPGASRLSPALLAADDRVALGHDRDAYVVGGCEIGLDDAIGVPTFRAIASVGWAPRVHDVDGDGVPDETDQCPDLPEDRDGIQDADGCPEDDADGDGILDDLDACPLTAGAASDDPRKNGCPSSASGTAPGTLPPEGKP